MKIINQSHEIQAIYGGLESIETAGRTCYQSQDKITKTSSEKFTKMLRDKGHHAMLEFGEIIVKFITNRGVTHELVRHRHCSFAQESTRYVKYSDNMEFILPVWLEKMTKDKKVREAKHIWYLSMIKAEEDYKQLLDLGQTPQQAREVLPNSLKTEIIVKANFREWRHILTLRTSKASHPQMRALMLPLLKELQEKIPILFDDINID